MKRKRKGSEIKVVDVKNNKIFFSRSSPSCGTRGLSWEGGSEEGVIKSAGIKVIYRFVVDSLFIARVIGEASDAA